MAVKSLEDLRKIREASLKKVELREKGEGTDNIIELLVGMATCGIAAGARDTLKVLLDEIDNQHLDNVRVVQVGCMGYCHSEPTVQVNKPGSEPVIYGKVDEKVAKEIIEKHVKGTELVDGNVLINTFQKA
jgi:NADP-reducing hydrogenase subunit HndB